MINEQDAKHAGKPAVDPETLQWEGIDFTASVEREPMLGVSEFCP